MSLYISKLKSIVNFVMGHKKYIFNFKTNGIISNDVLKMLYYFITKNLKRVPNFEMD